MNSRGKKAYLTIITITTICILIIVFLQPISWTLVDGKGETFYQIHPVYTLPDCLILALGSFLLGVMSSYLVIRTSAPEHESSTTGVQEEENKEITVRESEHLDREGIMIVPEAPSPPDPRNPVPESSKDTKSQFDAFSLGDQREMLKLLKGNERKIVEVLMDHGEMNQTELSGRTGIPKSTLSRVLQGLEIRGLVYRYEEGMSKMVKLEKSK